MWSQLTLHIYFTILLQPKHWELALIYFQGWKEKLSLYIPTVAQLNPIPKSMCYNSFRISNPHSKNLEKKKQYESEFYLTAYKMEMWVNKQNSIWSHMHWWRWCLFARAIAWSKWTPVQNICFCRLRSCQSPFLQSHVFKDPGKQLQSFC